MDNSSLIIENVRKHISIDEKEQDMFFSLLERKSIKKREVLHKAGNVCRHSTFILTGGLKGYTLDKKRNEHVVIFALRNWWIADMYSLITQRPGVLTIEAIADSEILMLPREKQQLLYQQIPKFERFFRILAENSLVAHQQRIINNLTLTAGERYAEFVKTYPFVLECASLQSIASYLGMTPEFLSKIRRQLAGK
jgi:CRP-like cAMP-binding protein